MKPCGTPDKGKKGVEIEPLKDTVHNLPLRYDQSLLGSIECSTRSKTFNKAV